VMVKANCIRDRRSAVISIEIVPPKRRSIT
jgi:hypothetical protein